MAHKLGRCYFERIYNVSGFGFHRILFTIRNCERQSKREKKVYMFILN